MSPRSIDRRHGPACRRPTINVWLVACVVPALGTARAHANIREPILEPQQPSSAAHAPAANEQLEVLCESLSFRCGEDACEVEARYRISARAPITTELAFVLPQPAPLSVRVNSTMTAVDVSTPIPELVGEDEVGTEAVHLQRRHLVAVQARFTAAFAAGENDVIVSYRQPLGREEYDHSYFSRGRFVKFFRYELWPLREWRHAPGFHVDGEVVIHRPPPSWWQRLFSQPRSIGCVGSELLRKIALIKRGDELRLTFQATDPIPRRLWCQIGDQDLVPHS